MTHESDMSLRPREGESAEDVIERVTRAAKATSEPTASEVARCTCGIVRNPDYAAMRQQYGSRLHSPHCAVGEEERAGS